MFANLSDELAFGGRNTYFPVRLRAAMFFRSVERAITRRGEVIGPMQQDNWLSSGAWQGIAGIIAIVTLAIMIYDRKGQKKPTYIFRATGFFIMGMSYGLCFCGLATFTGRVLSYFGVHAIDGQVGELGFRLSRIEFGYWQFDPNLPILALQLGALTLWSGTLFCGSLGLLIGNSIDYKLYKLDKSYLVIPIFSIFVILFIAIQNIALRGGF